MAISDKLLPGGNGYDGLIRILGFVGEETVSRQDLKERVCDSENKYGDVTIRKTEPYYLTQIAKMGLWRKCDAGMHIDRSGPQAACPCTLESGWSETRCFRYQVSRQP